MKYECDIVKDLMPLYIDDLLSENSKKFVEDHINSCESCKNYYDKLSSEVKIPVSKKSFGNHACYWSFSGSFPFRQSLQNAS